MTPFDPYNLPHQKSATENRQNRGDLDKSINDAVLVVEIGGAMTEPDGESARKQLI